MKEVIKMQQDQKMQALSDDSLDNILGGVSNTNAPTPQTKESTIKALNHPPQKKGNSPYHPLPTDPLRHYNDDFPPTTLN
jgi:hypothetical protein